MWNVFFFFLENELCKMQEFFFYGIFDQLFFFFLTASLPFFFFFAIFSLTTKKRNKPKNWARRIGLCSKSEFTYLYARVCETNLIYFLGLICTTSCGLCIAFWAIQDVCVIFVNIWTSQVLICLLVSTQTISLGTYVPAIAPIRIHKIRL